VSKRTILFLALFAITGHLFAAQKKSSKAPPPSSSKKRTARRTRGAVARPAARHHGQQEPTPDRYREIQQALAAKGYYKGSVNGEWGPESMEALKQFQTNQKLKADGKLDSMSLIALGLGPKRLTAQAAAQPGAQREPR
jgi:peptidoglycan hydrolase-like protein with peptidoglycan-binding domain